MRIMSLPDPGSSNIGGGYHLCGSRGGGAAEMAPGNGRGVNDVSLKEIETFLKGKCVAGQNRTARRSRETDIGDIDWGGLFRTDEDVRQVWNARNPEHAQDISSKNFGTSKQ